MYVCKHLQDTYRNTVCNIFVGPILPEHARKNFQLLGSPQGSLQQESTLTVLAAVRRKHKGSLQRLVAE